MKKLTLLLALGLSNGCAGNSNARITTLASPTPQARATPQISRTDTDPATVNPDAIVVAIPEDDQFFIGRAAVGRNDIPQRVGALLRDRPPDQQTVYIKARATVQHGTVVSLIDSLRESGIAQIGLVADRREAEFSSVISQQNLVGQSVRRRIQAIRPTDEIVVTVGLGGPRAPNVRVNSIPLFLSELGATLREILAARDDKTVFIEASERIEFGAVVQIIDVVNIAGATSVRLRLRGVQTNINGNRAFSG